MKIERISSRGESCNFCDRGKLAGNGIVALVYPYNTVVSFAGNSSGIRANICDECLNELTEWKQNESKTDK